MKDDPAFLRHMLDATEQILAYTEDLDREAFGDRQEMQDAVVRQFEILGEAAKQVPEDIKEDHPGVPWADIAGMRDRLIHGYFRVDLDLVWETARRDVPPVRDALEAIIDEEGPGQAGTG